MPIRAFRNDYLLAMGKMSKASYDEKRSTAFGSIAQQVLLASLYNIELKFIYKVSYRGLNPKSVSYIGS